MEIVNSRMVCTEAEREEKDRQGLDAAGDQVMALCGVPRREHRALQHVHKGLWEGVWLEPVLCEGYQSIRSQSNRKKEHHGDPWKATTWRTRRSNLGAQKEQ